MAYTRYYIYKKQISLDGGTTWNDLYPSEIVPSGTPIGTYDTLLECNGTEMYRWVKTDDVSCKEIPTLEEILYGKYYIYKRQVSYDSGSTWNDTGYEVTSGDPITVYDAKMHCERDAIYRWEYKDMCINLDKYSIKVKQFSLDSGATWEDESPSKNEYLYVGTYNATSCDYKNPYEDGIYREFYNYDCCCSDYSYIRFFDYNENLGSVWYSTQGGGGTFSSKMNLGAPSSGYNICGITGYGMGKVKSAGNIDLTRLDGKAVKEVSACTKISIGYGVTSIANYSFMFGNLEELVIPNTISSIADGAFFGSSYLKRVVMLGTTPPEIGENTFPHSDILTIYVPPESVDKYKTASGWTSYSDYIVGFGSQKTPPSTYKVKITDVFGYDYYISCDGNSTLTSGNTNIYVYNGDNSIITYVNPKTKIKEIEVGSCVTTLGAYSIGHANGLNTLFDNVSKVTIPNNVTTIDGSAFENCTMLTNVTIPNSVTSIGASAFMNCCHLSAVTIPSSVTSMGTKAFYGCYDLPVENNIRYADTYLVNVADNTLSNYTIKSGTKWIGFGAFVNCKNMTSINIPNSVISIDDSAFEVCSGLTSVTIPDSVTSIGYEAFQWCYSLSSVTIPNSVISIGIRAFDETPWWNAYVADESNYYGNILYVNDIAHNARSREITNCQFKENTVSINAEAFANCMYLTSIDIPSGVTKIGDNAFYSTSLTSVDIPNSVTSIGTSAFRDCSRIKTCTIGSGVTSINNDVFSGCTSLSSVTIPNTVTSINDGAFNRCSGLTSVVIPDSVTKIGTNTFEYCSGLTSVTIGSGVTSIGDRAFYYCPNIRNLDTLSGVTSIGASAFSWCENVESITLSNNLTEISDFAFCCFNRMSIPSLTIPSSVKRIGQAALGGIPILYVEALEPPTLGVNAISAYTDLIYVPAESLEAYKTAWEHYASRIYPIPNS